MKRLVAVLFLLVLGGVLATQAYAWYQLRAGRTALERYKTAEARGHLDACLRLWPPERNGSHPRRSGRPPRRRLRGRPQPPRSLPEDRGQAIRRRAPRVGPAQGGPGELAGGRGVPGRAGQKDPAVAPLVWEALAEGDVRMYRTRAAMTLLDDWLEADPDNPRAHFLRGNVYRQGSIAKAVPDYRRAVELDPDDDEARWWLAAALQEAGQFDEALLHLERLRDRGWPDRDLRPRLARSLDRLDRSAEARAVCSTPTWPTTPTTPWPCACAGSSSSRPATCRRRSEAPARGGPRRAVRSPVPLHPRPVPAPGTEGRRGPRGGGRR